MAAPSRHIAPPKYASYMVYLHTDIYPQHDQLDRNVALYSAAAGNIWVISGNQTWQWKIHHV